MSARRSQSVCCASWRSQRAAITDLPAPDGPINACTPDSGSDVAWACMPCSSRLRMVSMACCGVFACCALSINKARSATGTPVASSRSMAGEIALFSAILVVLCCNLSEAVNSWRRLAISARTRSTNSRLRSLAACAKGSVWLCCVASSVGLTLVAVALCVRRGAATRAGAAGCSAGVAAIVSGCGKALGATAGVWANVCTSLAAAADSARGRRRAVLRGAMAMSAMPGMCSVSSAWMGATAWVSATNTAGLARRLGAGLAVVSVSAMGWAFATDFLFVFVGVLALALATGVAGVAAAEAVAVLARLRTGAGVAAPKSATQGTTQSSHTEVLAVVGARSGACLTVVSCSWAAAT